ncbi:MAG: hypothetical protein JKY88_09355 [Pseudomonadales bacterium]|nr:hypothetical protein [Pseudomonadales bacterium]
MFRPIVLILTSILTLLNASPAEAKLKDFVKLDKFSDVNLGLWASGDGDQTWTNLHCVASSNYNNKFNDPPPIKTPPAVHMPYQFRVKDRAAPAGYYLYLDDDDTNTGSSRLQVSFEHRDIKEGTAFEGLSDNVYDAHGHDGQFNKCKNGKNSELRLVINSAELSKARAGTYTGNFQFRVRGGSSGTKVRSRQISFTIDVAESVRISGLNNIPLGSWSGVGDLTGSETFCIYSNNAAAAYNVLISSSQQDGAGNFRLANGTLTSFINYSIRFADSALGAGVAVGLLPLSGNGSNGQADCGGVSNARLIVDLAEVDLVGSSSDTYSDTITLLVAPE